MVILNLSFRRWLGNRRGNRREGEKVPLQALPRVPPRLLHQQRPSQISLLITSKPAGVSCRDCLPITVRSRERNADLQTSIPNFMVDFHGGGPRCCAWRLGATRHSAYRRDGQGGTKIWVFFWELVVSRQRGSTAAPRRRNQLRSSNTSLAASLLPHLFLSLRSSELSQILYLCSHVWKIHDVEFLLQGSFQLVRRIWKRKDICE